MARTDGISVSVNSVDVSATVTGQISVRAEENQARTAQVTYLPGTGTYDPEDWLGVAVTIDHVADPDGTPAETRIFTGFINWTDLDENTGSLTLHCADLLQDYFEALTTDAAILAVITGAKLQTEVFGEREDGWQRAQDALSTVRKEAHKSRAGAVTLTDWAAKGTADYSYTSSGYIHASPKVTFSERREIINTMVVSYQYRYNRNKIREHTWGWAAGPTGGTPAWSSWCLWYASSHDLPTTEMIEQAASGTGWPRHGAVIYEHLPEAGTYSCAGGPVYWLGVTDTVAQTGDVDDSAQEEARKKIAYQAAWTGRKRFAQTITESYVITVACSGSVTKYGALLSEDGAVYSAPSDDSGWESSTDTSIPAGYSSDAIGDYVADQGDRDISGDVAECLLQLADSKIAGSHRRNYVEWRVPIEPTLDLEHTAQITAGRVTAKGKVYQLGHDLDLERGEFTTSIKIACSRGGGGSSDSLTAPTPPDTSPSHGAPASSTQLTNYIGGNDGVADWPDPATSYVAGNESIITTIDEDKIYPRRVQMVGPEIEEDARDAVDAPATPSYNVAVPDDTMTVSL